MNEIIFNGREAAYVFVVGFNAVCPSCLFAWQCEALREVFVMFLN